MARGSQRASKGPCSVAELVKAGAVEDDPEVEFCAACEAGEAPGGNVDLACPDCGHRSCEKGA